MTQLNANEYQVGGSHYKATIQHWDLVTVLGMDYLAGCATKYITRHRKKNGRVDMEKAVHYIQKLIECAAGGLVKGLGAPDVGTAEAAVLAQFLSEIKNDNERLVVRLLATWRTVAELYRAANMAIIAMAEEYPREEGAADSGYVNQDRKPGPGVTPEAIAESNRKSEHGGFVG